jgi:hypothetical protein
MLRSVRWVFNRFSIVVETLRCVASSQWVRVLLLAVQLAFCGGIARANGLITRVARVSHGLHERLINYSSIAECVMAFYLC